MKILDVETPLGILRLTQDGGNLCSAVFPEDSFRYTAHTPLLDEAKAQIDAYFSGRAIAFNLPLSIAGTEFEQQVMRALLGIPYGQTHTYSQIAMQIGRPKAVRAVGRACSRNRLLLFIPCHRVISAQGRLTGFAAGLNRKRALLALEGIACAESKPPAKPVA